MQCLLFFVMHRCHQSEGKPAKFELLWQQRDMINELLSAGPSNHQNELKSKPRTKDVGTQCGKYFTVCVHAVVYL